MHKRIKSSRVARKNALVGGFARTVVGNRQSRNIYLVPAGVFLGLLAVFPLIRLTQIAFSDVTVSSIVTGDWAPVGWANFTNVVNDDGFLPVVGNTLVFVVVVTVFGLLGGLLAALALARPDRFSGFVLALMVFVWALPPVVNGSVWKFLLGSRGLINSVLLETNLISSPVPFLYDIRFALVSVALVNVWAVVPFNTLVFRAAMLGIPSEQLEAARLDGARPSQEIRHVILPGIRATGVVLAVLTIVYSFRSFDYIYVMTFGGPGVATTTLPFLGYLKAFALLDFGGGAATAFLVVIVVVVLAFLYAASVRKEERG